ncbi:MAG: DNA polymerase III subunit gamma/tau, partial [Novosphingobium sp.]
RISAPMLAEHFTGICQAEGVEAEVEALAMVAAAAEGSVRDGLSILDQAIAHADLDGGGQVTAAKVRDMLGLADRSVQRRLFATLLSGDGPTLLELVKAQFALGVEPLALVRSAMELTHRVTVAQLGAQSVDAASADEREAILGWAKGLSAAQLHRLWQLLLKGFDEVRTAPDPLIAAEMALLRVMLASDLPDPGSLVKQLEGLAARAAAAPAAMSLPAGEGAPASSAAPTVPSVAPQWTELVARVDHSGQLRIAQIMRDWIRVVSLAPGKLCFALVPGYPGDPSADVREALGKVTGERWLVELTADQESAPSLREVDEAKKAAAQAELMRSPLVEATFRAFPGAELVREDESAPDRGTRNWSKRA